MAGDPLLLPGRGLGLLKGPLLVFGGPLGNLEATRDLVFSIGDRLGIRPSNMICTGDVGGYFSESEACAALLRGVGVETVLGNVEEALIADADDCGCGFAAGSLCDRLAREWYAHARERMTDFTLGWLARLPRRLAFTYGGARFAVIHGGARCINRYLFASDEAALAEEIAVLGADAVIAGHCGLPFTRVIGDAVWHNPGALGLPANDGTPRVWYSVIEETPDGIAFRHQPLDYHHELEALRARSENMPEPYVTALGTGLWPDTSILPAPEAAATGRRLDPAAAVWQPPRRDRPSAAPRRRNGGSAPPPRARSTRPGQRGARPRARGRR